MKIKCTKKVSYEMSRYPINCKECPYFSKTPYRYMNECGEEGHCELGYFEDDMRDFSVIIKYPKCNIQNDPRVSLMKKDREKLREFLLDQDVWDREVDEILDDFTNDVTVDDLKIVVIFNSLYDLAENYIDSVIGSLDHYIDSVLDYEELGKRIAENGDEYMILSTGRIVEFEL